MPVSSDSARQRLRNWPLASVWRSGRLGATLKRIASQAREDNLTDWAAALTYYTVLALFPALLVLVALVGLFGQYPQTTDALLDIVRHVSPDSGALDGLRETIDSVVRNKGGAGALLGLGLLGALWSASGYIGAFMRASNAIYGVTEKRKFWQLRPLQLAMTLGAALAVAALLGALAISGPVAAAIGDVVGLGDEALAVYGIIKWPLMVALALMVIAVLYYLAPNVELPRFRWVTPGSLLALAIWVLASLGFAFYVANFGSYNETYGALGGAISLLVWVWLTNLALLLGQEVNAEVERSRELAAGLDASQQLKLPQRESD